MTDKLTLFAFNTGWFNCKPGFFIEGDKGDFITSPVPAYLIDHPKGRALFDTGLGVRFRREADDALAQDTLGMEWFEGMDIAARLRAIDVDPASINYVVNSHLHADHCGGNILLPNATIVLQRPELDKARNNPVPGLYVNEDFETGQPFKLIDGEHDLFGDGTVRIVPTYGHSPGHQSMIIKLGGTEVMLAGDCCYTERNLDVMGLPKGTDNLEVAMDTLRRLAKLRDSGTLIVYGHDRHQWAKVPQNTAFRP